MPVRQDATDIRCPYCRSDNVRRHKWSGGWFALPLLITGIPLIVPSKWHHCFECSKDFKLGKQPAKAGSQTTQHRQDQARIVVFAFLALLVLILLLV